MDIDDTDITMELDNDGTKDTKMTTTKPSSSSSTKPQQQRFLGGSLRKPPSSFSFPTNPQQRRQRLLVPRSIRKDTKPVQTITKDVIQQEPIDNPYLKYSSVVKPKQDLVEEEDTNDQLQTEQQKQPPTFYGNYSSYYGYRQQALSNDVKHLDQRLISIHPKWIANRTVLDIGCNVGFLTIQLAQLFKPKHVVAIDMDNSLITKAREKWKWASSLQHTTEKDNLVIGHFPSIAVSMYGHRPNTCSQITFKQGDIMNGNVFTTTPFATFDTICAFSITKWIHLQHGDEGIKRFFARVYSLLNPNGVFILEPQPWSSYTKSKTQSSQAKEIQFRPEHFVEYLCSEEIGFKRHVLLRGVNRDNADNKEDVNNGFNRPIYAFFK